MKTEEKKLPKGCNIAFVIGFIVLAIYIAVKIITWAKSPKEIEKSDYSQEWSGMNYEERNELLNKQLTERNFLFASELEIQLRDAIKKECINPKTVRFQLSPSIYNGLANIVEADSGWIYVPFKCTAKNDFGIEKEIAGSVMYLYKPETNSLEVKQWDVNQNN